MTGTPTPRDPPPASPPRSTLGRHLLADLHDIEPRLLSDADALCTLITDAALASGACVLDAHFHHFGGESGVTGVVLLSESHISIHTWPEYGYAALDIFMCGQAQPELALKHIREGLGSVRADITTVPRGMRETLPGA